MGYTYTGDAKLGASLTVTTPKPLDARLVVNTINDLYSIPKDTAYQGMTVANIQDGNMYMLIDKEKINQKIGWKASYESLQIIACSQAEYDEWNRNTNSNFTPKDSGKPYIYPNTYYYTYDQGPDDSITDDQHYMSSRWGKEIEAQLSTKASTTFVNALNGQITDLETLLQNNYSTSEQLTKVYVPLTAINLEDPESFLSKTLKLYYNRVEADSTFIKREELQNGSEGSQDFIFVTKSTYDLDKQNFQKQLDQTLKVDGQGQLESITVGQIKSPSSTTVEPSSQLVVDVKPEGLFVGEDKFATVSEIPELVTITSTEYKDLTDKGQLDLDTYYFITDVEDGQTYVTRKYLDENYHNRSQYQSWSYSTFYSKSDVNVVLKKDLEPYVLTTTLESNYLTSADISSTYATQASLTELDTKLTTDYVTKESLRGGQATEGDDFIFVTQNKYNQDVTANALHFTSETLTSTTSETGTINLKSGVDNVSTLTSVNNRLMLGGKQIALNEEIPEIVCIPQEDYEALETPDPDVFYYTYDPKGAKDNGYVTNDVLESTYCKSVTFNLEIARLKAQIQQLEDKINTLTPNSPTV